MQRRDSPATRWYMLTHLDWPRFLRAFLFADLSTVVIPVWELASRFTGTGPDSSKLDELRTQAMDARSEMLDLLNDAMGPVG